jgi:hypothetical protein
MLAQSMAQYGVLSAFDELVSSTRGWLSGGLGSLNQREFLIGLMLIVSSVIVVRLLLRTR